MLAVRLMVSVSPESGFLDVPSGRGSRAGRVRQLEADWSIGESEQKVELTVGIMRFGFRQALSRGLAG